MTASALLMLTLLVATTQTVGQTRCRSGQVEMLIGGRAEAQCEGQPRAPAPLPASLRDGGNDRVSAQQQRQRDDERLAILRAELASEQALLARLQSQRPADAAAQARSRANVEALNREIARAQQPSPRS